MARFKFKLGAKAQDAVTGFEGTIIARNEWLNGCVQYCLKPPVDKDGKIPDGEWIDQQQVKLVRQKVKIGPPEKTGGPQKDAPRG